MGPAGWAAKQHPHLLPQPCGVHDAHPFSKAGHEPGLEFEKKKKSLKKRKKKKQEKRTIFFFLKTKTDMHGLRCTYCYSASDPRVLASSRTGRDLGSWGPKPRDLDLPQAPSKGCTEKRGVGTWAPPEETGHSCEGGCSPSQALPIPRARHWASFLGKPPGRCT